MDKPETLTTLER